MTVAPSALLTVLGLAVACSLRSPSNVAPQARPFDAPQALAAAAPRPSPRQDASGRRAVEWLKQQLTPRFLSRHGRSARLIDSYEDRARAGWTYDAALAAIALTAAGDLGLAADLMSGLEHLQNEDGSWVSSFDPDAATIRGSDRYVGAMAWVVMAANFYEWETGDDRFAAMARRGLAYLETFRIADEQSDRHGAFLMGPASPGVISTEHNADCYAAFFWRGRLDGDERVQAIAEDVRAFVFRRLWTDPADAASNAFFRVGPGAAGVYLDAQTWTLLAFKDGTRDERLQQAIRSAEEILSVTTARLGSIEGITGLDDSEHGADGEKVWAEGTEGMVAALFSLGEFQRARHYHAETARYQSLSGGIPYATENSDDWSTAPAVAATGWYVLNSLFPPRNPFYPDTATWTGANAPDEPFVR